MQIENLELFLTKISKSFPDLEYLSLLNNPCCPNQLTNSTDSDDDYKNYRFRVVETLKQLKFLDSTKVVPSERYRFDNVELPTSPTNTAETPVKRNKFSKFRDVFNSSLIKDRQERETNYNALPSGIREPGHHSGAYTKCKFRYVGAHSEGNRFISNNDL